MEFATDDFVFHKTYGVGIVTMVEPKTDLVVGSQSLLDDKTQVTVMFQDGKTLPFTTYLMERSCQKVSPLGFRAFAYLDPEGATKMLEQEPVEAILLSLQDFPGLRAKNEYLKDYLAPYLPEWDSWWEKTQPKLKDDPRIDTSRSKQREYGISRELNSRAEETYLSFNRLRHSEPIAYNQAKQALNEYQNGQALPDAHRDDLISYFEFVVRSEKFPISDRLDALFRLIEGKWDVDFNVDEKLNALLQKDLRLYELDVFPLNRTIDYLLKSPNTDTRLVLLGTGMCSTGSVCTQLTDWALKQGKFEPIRLFLRAAFSENLPPDLDEEKYPALKERWENTRRLISALPPSDLVWPELIKKFSDMLIGISQINLEKASTLSPTFGMLANHLYRHIGRENEVLEDALLRAVIQPAIPIKFLLEVLDNIKRTKNAKEFFAKLESYLWEFGENRGYDFLKDFSQQDIPEKVLELVEKAVKYDSQILTEKIGERVCELIKKNQTDDLSNFLIPLNRLHNILGNWSWSRQVESLREEIYFQSFKQKDDDGLSDRALTTAVNRFVAYDSQQLRQSTEVAKAELVQAKKQINELKTFLDEKEAVIKELRSGFGGDTAGARFEERTRILKELVGSIAEFERAAVNLPEQSRGMEAILKRLNNIIIGLQVASMEAISTVVKYDPQKHRAMDSEHIAEGQPVVIFERGFLIRDNSGKLRLLKPAMVKKQI